MTNDEIKDIEVFVHEVKWSLHDSDVRMLTYFKENTDKYDEPAKKAFMQKMIDYFEGEVNI
jgi:hypothetical protein